jgi:regulator of cell morphogenesis and NO signaling
MNPNAPNPTLDEFLLAVPEQRRLFDNLGIDTRRDHNKSLAEVCQKHDLDLQTVARMLTALQGTPPQRQVVTLELMTLAELCDHLGHTQQDDLRDELARLDRLTRTAAQQEGAKTPQFLRIRETFVAFHEQFAAHLREEAEEVFPVIRRLTAGEDRGLRSSLRFSLARMKGEHNQADEALAELRALAGDGSSQRSVPVAMRTVSKAIVRLEHAVHEQIYKENQVFFPRALASAGAK